MSKLRVNDVLPANGLNIGIGTAGGNLIVGGASTTVVVNGGLKATDTISASTFIGDGSGITGVTASGSGVNINDSNSIVGVAGTINFGTNLNVSPASAGIVTVTVGDTDFEIADKIVHTGDTNTAIRFPAADTVSVETGGSERLRINSDGDVCIGINTNFGTENENVNIASAGGGRIALLRNDTSISSGNELGRITWYSNDNTSSTYQQCAAIRALAAGTFGDGDKPTDLIFLTTPDNSNTPAERLRIDSDGNIGLNATAPYYKLHMKFSNSTTSLSGGSEGNWGSDGIRIENTNDTAGSLSLAHFRSYDADWHIGSKYVSNNNSDFIFFTEGDEKLRIYSDGHGKFNNGAITRVLVADDHTPSGTSQTYTSIPSWATKITIIFDRISMTGGSEFMVRLGTSGGTITSNYQSSSQSGSAGTTETSTAGFVMFNNSSSHTHTGIMTIEKLGTSSKWISDHHVCIATGALRAGNGVLTSYSGTIDRVVLTTEGGSNSFDNGTITVYAEA